MKALEEKVVLIFNGADDSELIAFIRHSMKKTKKAIIYKGEKASSKDIDKLIGKIFSK